MPLGVCSVADVCAAGSAAPAVVESAAAAPSAVESAAASGVGVAVVFGFSVGSGVGVESTTVTTASVPSSYPQPCARKAAPIIKAIIHFFFILLVPPYTPVKNSLRPIYTILQYYASPGRFFHIFTGSKSTRTVPPQIIPRSPAPCPSS